MRITLQRTILRDFLPEISCIAKFQASNVSFEVCCPGSSPPACGRSATVVARKLTDLAIIAPPTISQGMEDKHSNSDAHSQIQG
jgi:hypothetical protein